MSNHIVSNVLGPIEKIRVVPEIVAPQEAPTPSELHNFLGGRVGESDEAFEQFLG